MTTKQALLDLARASTETSCPVTLAGIALSIWACLGQCPSGSLSGRETSVFSALARDLHRLALALYGAHRLSGGAS